MGPVATGKGGGATGAGRPRPRVRAHHFLNQPGPARKYGDRRTEKFSHFHQKPENSQYPRVLLCLAANVVENTEVGTGLGCRSSLQKERTACIRSSGTGSIVFACTQHSSAHQ